MLSQGSVIFNSERTTCGSVSRLSATGKANNFYVLQLSHTRTKSALILKVYLLPKHYSWTYSIYLLQNNTIASCQLWVGRSSLNTTEQKFSVVQCSACSSFIPSWTVRKGTIKKSHCSKNTLMSESLLCPRAKKLSPKLD